MPAVSYGSVEGPAESKSFDEKDAYYLKESTLSPEEKRRKCMRMAFPIITAILIIGGFALFLLRDFDILYPGRGGNKNNKEPSDPFIPGGSSGTDHISEKHASQSPPSNDGKKTNMATSCFAHDKCSGLVGECCPTLDGIYLLCCD